MFIHIRSFIMFNLPSHVGFRVGQVRVFAGNRSTEDGAGVGLQAGLTTYSTNEAGAETYQTSYVELGGRTDHLTDAIAYVRGDEVKERLVSESTEHNYVGSPEDNAKAAEQAAKRQERKDARKAKKAAAAAW